MSNLQTPDIYDASSFINEIQKKYISTDNEDTMFMGIYGYLNEIFANSLQNANINAAEWGNEAFPILCKFDKSILTHAMTYNIDGLNAVPASMTVMIGFVKEELESNMDINGIFILDKDCTIEIEDFEFHLDYDVQIQRYENRGGEVIYTAKYNIDDNDVSDITNPYLPTPIQLKQDGSNFIFITCLIRQVSKEKIETRILANNIFENKTLDFSFDNQLVSFSIIVNDNGVETKLKPIFDRIPPYGLTNYCYYSYIDSNTIRIKFDRDIYEPKSNTTIKILLQTSRGSEGNFVYDGNIIQALNSTNYKYKNLSCLIKPVTDSVYGIDKKSISELKDIIPKEILSRGNITNNKDLQNFFNMINSSKLYIFKRRDNQKERLYYAYLLIKDQSNNIIPTNTLNLEIKESEFKINNNRLILLQNNLLEYSDKKATVLDFHGDLSSIENERFIYRCPFVLVVNKKALSVSYYSLDVNTTSYFKFLYINSNSLIQFISTKMTCKRTHLNRAYPNSYILEMVIAQNSNIDEKLVTLDINNQISYSKIVPIIILEDINGKKYYKKGNITSYTQSNYNYTIRFILDTNNIISDNNTIVIKDMYLENTSEKYDIEVSSQCKMYVYTYIESELKNTDTTVPSLIDSHIITNKYETDGYVTLMHNYSNIINSTVSISKNDDESILYKIKSVPVVRSSYIDNTTRYNNFLNYIEYRKAYINKALETLEDAFGIDMKFFNTYGPSKMFNIGYVNNNIDRVNISIDFKVRLKFGVNKDIVSLISNSIKEFIENINNELFEDIHMMNLITNITNKYSEYIEYIEFVGINNYDATTQYIQKISLENITDVPEFLNINLQNNTQPDINIELV